LMWARVAELLGVPEAGDAPQHAVTSSAMMSRRDPWVNMLRTTLASFGAGAGGATSVTVLPCDSSLPRGLASTSRSFAERIARNTQLLLLEDSHLGHVLDPAGGSWYVESLTDARASSARRSGPTPVSRRLDGATSGHAGAPGGGAWQRESLTERPAGSAWPPLQAIEGEGGPAAAIASGTVADAIARVREARDADIATRTAPVTGVSEFPDPGETPLEPAQRGGDDYRYGRAFEELRDRSDAHLEATGARPTVLIAGLGPQAETTGRVTFASNLLAAGGIEGRNPLLTGADDYASAREGETVAVLCGADKRYATEGPDAVRALRDAGIDTVYLAGREKGFPADA